MTANTAYYFLAPFEYFFAKLRKNTFVPSPKEILWFLQQQIHDKTQK